MAAMAKALGVILKSHDVIMSTLIDEARFATQDPPGERSLSERPSLPSGRSYRL